MTEEVYFGCNVGSNENHDRYKLYLLPSFVEAGFSLLS
jgi:hypothetical protein